MPATPGEVLEMTRLIQKAKQRDELLTALSKLVEATKALKSHHESWCASSRPQAFNPVYREWIRGGDVTRLVMQEVESALRQADAIIAKAEGQ